MADDDLLTERLLRVINEGRRTAPYKLALLLALTDRPADCALLQRQHGGCRSRSWVVRAGAATEPDPSNNKRCLSEPVFQYWSEPVPDRSNQPDQLDALQHR